MTDLEKLENSAEHWRENIEELKRCKENELDPCWEIDYFGESCACCNYGDIPEVGIYCPLKNKICDGTECIYEWYLFNKKVSAANGNHDYDGIITSAEALLSKIEQRYIEVKSDASK